MTTYDQCILDCTMKEPKYSTQCSWSVHYTLTQHGIRNTILILGSFAVKQPYRGLNKRLKRPLRC